MKYSYNFLPLGTGIFITAAILASILRIPLLGPFTSTRHMFISEAFIVSLVFFYRHHFRFYPHKKTRKEKFLFVILAFVLSIMYALSCLFVLIAIEFVLTS